MPAERYSLGTVTVRVRVQGPIGISATAPVVAVRYDDGTWDAETRRQYKVLQWTIAGASFGAADELTELISPSWWILANTLTASTVRRAIDEAVELAAGNRLAAWLASASSSEAAVHDHTRDAREGAAE
jgi:hypothetical protein